MYVYIYIYVHICTCMYVRAYIYTYTHIHKYVRAPKIVAKMRAEFAVATVIVAMERGLPQFLKSQHSSN